MKTRSRFQRCAALQGLAVRMTLASLATIGQASIIVLAGLAELVGMDFGGDQIKRGRRTLPPTPGQTEFAA